MDFKKLAAMAKIQSASEEEAEPAGSPTGTFDDRQITEPEPEPQRYDIYIPIDDENDDPDPIPDDGYAPADYLDNNADPDLDSDFDPDSTDAADNTPQSIESVIEKCFPDEKAYNIELERLLPYHSPIFSADGDISQLKSSIARIGITEPLLVRSAGNGDYEILGGSRRKKAAEVLLWTKVPCRIADNELLTEELEKRIVIESNRERLSELEFLSEKIRVCAALGTSVGADALGISDEQAEKYIIFKLVLDIPYLFLHLLIFLYFIKSD